MIFFLHDSICLFIYLNILSPMAKNRLQPLKYEWFYLFMVRILANINFLILLGLSIFDFIHCQNLNVLKLSIKSGKHNIESPCSTYLQNRTSNMVSKNYTWAQWAWNSNFEQDLSQTQFHGEFLARALPWEAHISTPYFYYAYTFIFFTYLLTSHVHLNVHTLIVKACISFGVSEGNMFFLSPYSFLWFFHTCDYYSFCFVNY